MGVSYGSYGTAETVFALNKTNLVWMLGAAIAVMTLLHQGETGAVYARAIGVVSAGGRAGSCLKKRKQTNGASDKLPSCKVSRLVGYRCR